jgi:transposase
MPGERLSMRQIREVLRLRFAQGLSQRAVGRSLGLSTGAVNGYLSRARRAGLSWPLPETLDDAGLEALLYPPPPDVAADRRPVPDWAVVHLEMRRPNVTLSLLWEEYRGGPGAQDGFGYSYFCERYSEWVGRLSPTMRQVHPAGERVFVDFAGHTVEVIDATTGEVHRAEVFVGVLGASSYVFAQATWTQSLEDWIAAHVDMLSFIGGVPRQIVSDNLRAGITRACFYEPLVNRTYADMASHYQTAVVPARPYKPRDKAKVEVGVQVVQRWILARLRNQRFFSLTELNQAIGVLVERVNDRPMRGWGTTRRALYEQIDRPALRALPPTAYEYATWKRCRVNIDYHIEVDKHFYSVPFRLLREVVEARVTLKTVEIFHRGKLVAAHLRSLRQHRPTTLPEHMPSSHRRYRDWTHERILRDAKAIGDDTAALVEVILRSRPHPEQGFRSCIGILGLAKRHGGERLDGACARALALGTRSYGSVAAILRNTQEKKSTEPEQPSLFHENIRGPGYYH